MKQFSKIKKADDEYPFAIYFDFRATEDPIDDLKALDLLVHESIHDVQGTPRHEGSAYSRTNSREGLEKAQAQLHKMGWKEMPED